MINSRIRLLVSMLICSLMFHAPLAAAYAPSKEDFNRFKSMILEKAKTLPGVAAIPAGDVATMWRYGVKKVTGKAITAQEKEKFDLALKRTGLPVVVVIGVVGTVLASAKLYDKYVRSKPKPIKSSNVEWVGRVLTPNDELMDAVAYCDLGKVQSLLKRSDVDVNYKKLDYNRDIHFSGESIFLQALKSECPLPIIKMLVNAGADIEDPEIAIQLNIIALDNKVLKYLIDSGYDLNQIIGGMTLIMRAVGFDNFDKVKLLVENKARLDFVDNSGHSALSMALSGKNRLMMHYLISRMSDDEIRRVTAQGDVFVVPIANEFYDIVKKLLERGVTAPKFISPNAIYNNDQDIVKLLFKYGAKPTTDQLQIPWVQDLYDKSVFKKTFKRAHQLGGHPLINRLPRELLGEIKKEL